MAIEQFKRMSSLPVAYYFETRSIVTLGSWRLVARAADDRTVAIAVTPQQPRTAEFERDLQTFKDLCALTAPTT